MAAANSQSGHGGSINVHWDSNIAVIKLDRGENRMNMEFIDQMNAALDEALRNSDLKGINTTADGKYYSNGIDLAWFQETYNSDPGITSKFLEEWQNLQLRFLTCPVVTVAAINGHAFAGGGVMSMCHDFRIMQTSRGWWCLNEAQLGLNFPEWILKLLSLKLGGNGARVLLESSVFGKRFTAEQAKQSGIVDEACTTAELLPKAAALINSLVGDKSPGHDFVKTSKRNLFKDIIEAMNRSSLPAFNLKPHL
jgi:enoyl-CoA hydratase/carnithine racemase